ncbi:MULTISPECIES: 1-phosphofructokinase family hexose kinase [unclassified Microbacterium]|uniref:1-phosphofructokinase family hexose kinase n=1 Tax=unclassified Microbacterium TaxID=2609290 RepID=UPI00214B1516|nr:MULTISPECIES: 1-phosphofructokinase family hexose kinase [unclassified Microbacterium]MCR2809355.1 1-phosphofructokinase family hexose kinase [Microbacterium sp. zg.B185]WIM20494.1 1-phosphofructokinase family hexose kinase [Microbacterium sp. zg-B185]
MAASASASASAQHPFPHDPIVTATPNPALDVSTSVDRVVAEHKLRCGPTRLDPGGGGVNVSRVVRNLGGRSVAVYAIGGPAGQAYRDLLEREGVVGRAVRIAAGTRESFTVDETATGQQFRFVLQGPRMREPEWRAFLTAVADDMPVGGYIVPSGSLPPGAPEDLYARIARLAGERGTRCIVDSSGAALRAALDEGVYLIKPSRGELGELVGAQLEDEQSLLGAAQELVDAGACEVVALTLGADGALLVTADGALRLPTPKVRVQSTVGAGDSFLGAFVLRLAQGRDLRSAFRAAVAAGSATAMLPATELCRPEDVATLEAGLEPIPTENW